MPRWAASSRTKPIRVRAVKVVAGWYSTAERAAGSAPGRTSSPYTKYWAVAAVAVRARAMPNSSQPTGCAGAAGGHDRPDRGRAHQGQDGNGDAGEGELDQLGPAGLAQQLVQPGHGGQAEQAGQPQRPGQPGRPPARPARSGGRGHRRGPGCWQRTTDPATSHARQLPVWPACVRAALRRTDRPRLARGTYQSTARDSVLALPSDILSDALDHPDDHPDDRPGSFRAVWTESASNLSSLDPSEPSRSTPSIPSRNRKVAGSDATSAQEVEPSAIQVACSWWCVPGPTAAASPLDGPCRSHSDAWVGRMVWSTTASSSVWRASRSTWSRRRAANPR